MNPPHPHLPDVTRKAGLSRLDTFLTQAGAPYAQRRNFDYGATAETGVSALSPFVRHRTILEPEIIAAVLTRHTLAASEKFIQEVFWRGYFKGWLEQRPEVWVRYKSAVIRQAKALEQDPSLARDFAKATSGHTGITCFDHWAQELVATGYLHNHARMWFASIWIFTLKLPWELGADFFYRHLMDGDPAANTCSWRWVAGLHTKGKTYLARASNIDKFTNSRFPDTQGLAAEAIPLTEPDLPPLIPFTPPICDLSGRNFGLIITQEDCHTESLTLPQPPTAILALTGVTARSVLPMGKLAGAIGPSAVEDAAKRAEDHFGISVTRYDGADWAASLSAWWTAHNLDTVATPYLPVGPVRTRLERALKATDTDIPLQHITRPYDRAVWPFATAGFFKVKKKIPNIINGLTLERDLFSC